MSWKYVQRNDETGQYRTTDQGGGGGGSSTFAGLDDVSFTNLADSQVPKYNSNTQKWENEENSLANLSDTSMLTLSDKQVLSYNARTQKWENRSNSVSRLSDVSLNSPSDGDILRYNAQSGEWENTTMPDSYIVYSTTEQVIGEWIDGKPIYKKSYDLGSDTNISYNSWTEVNANYPANCGLIIHVDCTTSGGTYASGISVEKRSNGKFGMQTCRNANNQSIRYFTIQYTKTTD